MITREDYQRNRFSFLCRFVNVAADIGLEIGAADLPTVMVKPNRCRYADFRSREEMAALWNLDASAMPKVDFVVRRDQPLSGQIPPDRYGYIVLAHVLEHIADPIGYLVDLVGLLAPGGVLVIMLPDKRRTHDEPRPVTSLQHLLNDFHEKPTYPSVEHIMEYAPCVIDDLKGKDLGTVFHWARANHATGQADVHCHVWRDEDFFAQVDQLIAMGVLANVAAAGRWHNRGEFNEFMLALRAR
ncbi:MAG TPA: methyltransferase domain-containing protein [Candidatus Binatia bacterium]|nr:methyltransferase domain-containing protein [Candidatus Binatia bacterium]